MKFLTIQLISLFILLAVLYTTPISQQLPNSSLLSLVNTQTFMCCFAIHSFLPLLIMFFLLRVYLGHVYILNKLVSRKFNYHQNSDDSESNLDGMLY